MQAGMATVAEASDRIGVVLIQGPADRGTQVVVGMRDHAQTQTRIRNGEVESQLGQAFVQQFRRVDRGTIARVGRWSPPRDLHGAVARMHPALGEKAIDDRTGHEVAQKFGDQRRGFDDVAITVDDRMTECRAHLGRRRRRPTHQMDRGRAAASSMRPVTAGCCVPSICVGVPLTIVAR